MLPWVYLDGADSSLSGGELIAYWLATGSEQTDMFRESVPGAMALFLVPWRLPPCPSWCSGGSGTASAR